MIWCDSQCSFSMISTGFYSYYMSWLLFPLEWIWGPDFPAKYSVENSSLPFASEQNYTFSARLCERHFYVLLVCHGRKTSTSIFILFVPFARISFRLRCDSVGSDALNTILQGVHSEFSFQTVDHGMKFWMGFSFNWICCTDYKFLT